LSMLNRLALAAVLVAGSTRMVAAQEPSPAPEPSPEPAPEQRVVIHGYFSQAYANSSEHQLIGVPDSGTFDYRRMALLLRGTITSKDSLVLQIAQRRLGESPVMSIEPDVKLDWAFYEHRFGNATSVRVGRIPTPLGLYSEVRYVGTVLPFYRAPYNFYQEGSFTTENVNGVRVSHTFAAAKPWNLEAQLFGGGFSTIEAYYGQVNRAYTNNALGGQLWLNTPVEGLRFGAGGDFFDIQNTILDEDGKDKWKTWVASADLSRTRFRIRAEYSQIRIKRAEFTDKAFYVYAGVNLTEKLVAHAQYDTSSAILGTGDQSTTLPKLYQDTTLGLSYAFRPDVVLKGEYHLAKGRLIEDEKVPLQPGFGPYKGNYFILSVSASF
jgi:hypothetical protein